MNITHYMNIPAREHFHELSLPVHLRFFSVMYDTYNFTLIKFLRKRDNFGRLFLYDIRFERPNLIGPRTTLRVLHGGYFDPAIVFDTIVNMTQPAPRIIVEMHTRVTS